MLKKIQGIISNLFNIETVLNILNNTLFFNNNIIINLFLLLFFNQCTLHPNIFCKRYNIIIQFLKTINVEI